uniref:Ig-like domain-containing protein n=1 Tax=Naja naja TaxID=35670 RepID=A0A8C6VDL2_NAJNA
FCSTLVSPGTCAEYHLLLTRLQKCLFFVSVVTGQNMEVTQVPETVSVTAGGNLTLKCTLTGRNLFRSVQWYKGLDRNQAPIYSDKRGASNRGVRVIPGSTRDFSINIQNVHPEDAGTYYCVKFTTLFTWRELASGKGTLVSVTGQNMEVTQFPENVLVKAGENLTLNCTVTGENLFRSVQWYKGLDRNQAPIYSDNQGVSNRGVRVIPGSTRDFSINIQNVHPEDAGTYYCVTCRVGFQERELSSGKGTLVSIIGSPSQIFIPAHNASPTPPPKISPS